MHTRWTRQASKNLESILEYIAADNPLAAKKLATDALLKIERLEDFPLMGRTGILPMTRELVIHENYIVHYRVRDENIEILRVLHAKRKFPSR